MRDADGDGVPETRSVFLKELNSPSAWRWWANDLYVANADAVVRFLIAKRRADHCAGNQARELPAVRAIITDQKTSSPTATARSSTRP